MNNNGNITEFSVDNAPVENREDDLFLAPVEEAEAEAEENDSEYKPSGIFELSTPFEMDGQTVKEIKYDFSTLKPIQYNDIVRKVSKSMGGNLLLPAFDQNVQANVFCRASGLSPAIIKTMFSVPDFEAACSLARDFLLSGKGRKEEEEMF